MMKRRELFEIGKSKSTLTTSFMSLAPYDGEWTALQAGHLLRRSTFGFTITTLQEVVNDGMDTTINRLFEDIPLPEPPVNPDFENDPDVPVGETWVEAPYDIVNQSNNYRMRSILAWTADLLLKEEVNIREQMTLFWHNHFVTSNVNDARYRYRYINLLRSNANGNFRELVKAITIDPAMLRYLNGRQNNRNSPNENYARELLELFTIGKGPQVGDGDYTYFTEQDVRAAARVLTGWVDSGYNSTRVDQVDVSFLERRHDTTDKVFSHRFNDRIISNSGAEEYKLLIDMIFTKEEVSKFISRKLFRWFVHYDINEEIESEIIVPLAQIIRDSDYEVGPAVKTLLSSSYFYSECVVGCMIKNPMGYFYPLMKALDIAGHPDGLSAKYNYQFRLFNSTRNLEMLYYSPPSVAGWSQYYQEPSYYQSWLNAVTLPLRQELSDGRVLRGYNIGDFRNRPDYLGLIAKMENPYEVNGLLHQIVELFLSKPVTEAQHDVIKSILLPGLPDYEWSEEYSAYISDPTNTNLANALNAKLRDAILYITRMPEFQLS